MQETDGWKRFRHRITLLTDNREQSHYTHFVRLPTQFEALCGPVLDYLELDRPLRIVVIGCSIGKEPYSISSELLHRRPGLDFGIDAYDLVEEVVERARTARYDDEDIASHDAVPAEFIERTFDREGGAYIVRQPIRERVTFGQLDVFSEAIGGIEPADVVYVQNFLFHLKPALAHRAFDQACRLLRPRAALFIDGIDLPVRTRAARRNGLTPLRYKIREIHDENERHYGWPYQYWGLEPYDARRRDRDWRYGTIFLKGAGETGG
jgi:chemotaxis methyl-accepting protein methylase